MAVVLHGNKKQKVYQCYHCGNQTLMTLVGEHKENWGDINFHGFTIYCMYLCHVCQNMTYVEQYWDESMIGFNYHGEIENIIDEKICYPAISLDTSYVPEKIKAAFEGALKSRYTDSALCLIGLRRTLEILCKDQGATKRTLEAKLEELVNTNILPPTLNEASNIARRFGNSAAHADDLEVSAHELTMIIEFIEALIEYIYVIPQKLKRFNLSAE